MDKISKILMILWMALGLVSFVGSFFIGLSFFKISGIVFGILNMLVSTVLIPLFFNKKSEDN